MKTLCPHCLLLLTCFLCGTAAAQDCKILKQKPIASTNQGGYAFDYYSGQGRDCRTYKIRNHPGGLKTPVLWQSKAEIFFDTLLAECDGSRSSCEWLTVQKNAFSPYSDSTQLSYGLNKDEYKEKPEAYIDALRQASVGQFSFPLITSVVGRIIDTKGEPTEIGIRVTSSVGKEGTTGFKLKYDFALSSNSVKMQVISAENEASRVVIRWESAESALYTQSVGSLENKVIEPDRLASIEMTASNVEISSERLVLTQRGKEIFATTAAAYRAKSQ